MFQPGQCGQRGQYEQPRNLRKRPAIAKHKSDKVSNYNLKIGVHFHSDIIHTTHCPIFIVLHFDLLSPAEPRRANVLTAWESSPTLDTTSTNSTCRYREEFINLTHNFKLAYWRWPRPWLLTFYVEKTLFVWLVLSVALLGKSNVWTQNVEQRRFCS